MEGGKASGVSFAQKKERDKATYSWRSNNSNNDGRSFHRGAVDEGHVQPGLVPVQVAASGLLGLSSRQESKGLWRVRDAFRERREESVRT